MAEFDQAFADKVLIVSARLAKQEKFIDMDVIEDVLRTAAEVDVEAAQDRRAAAAAAYVPVDQRGVQIGDLVHVPRGVDVVCETGYRIRVARLSSFGPDGPRIKANGEPMVSRSVLNEGGFVERAIPWELIPQCTVTKPEPAAAVS
jgi:hypothetical protein